MTTDVIEAPQAAAVPAIQSDASALVSVIERVAMSPDVDITKLEKMLDMQERIFNREAERSFNASMAKAQAEMGPVSYDAENSQTRSKYATYSAIDRAVRPIYTRHGFALSFNTEPTTDGYVRVVCIVSHRDGHSRTYTADMPADGLGAKGGAVMTKTHAAGSAMSYGQRYLLKLIFNVAVGEDDTDGNVYRQDVLDELLGRIEQAQTPQDLIAIKREGTAIIQKARDRDGYRRFAAAVSDRMDTLQGGQA